MNNEIGLIYENEPQFVLHSICSKNEEQKLSQMHKHSS